MKKLSLNLKSAQNPVKQTALDIYCVKLCDCRLKTNHVDSWAEKQFYNNLSGGSGPGGNAKGKGKNWIQQGETIGAPQNRRGGAYGADGVGGWLGGDGSMGNGNKGGSMGGNGYGMGGGGKNSWGGGKQQQQQYDPYAHPEGPVRPKGPQKVPDKYTEEQETKLDAWVTAKRTKNFEDADRIRDELKEEGIDAAKARPKGYVGTFGHALGSYTEEQDAKLDEWVAMKRAKNFEAADALRAELRMEGIDCATARPGKQGNAQAWWAQDHGGTYTKGSGGTGKGYSNQQQGGGYNQSYGQNQNYQRNSYGMGGGMGGGSGLASYLETGSKNGFIDTSVLRGPESLL
jgi:hypothetical protein